MMILYSHSSSSGQRTRQRASFVRGVFVWAAGMLGGLSVILATPAWAQRSPNNGLYVDDPFISAASLSASQSAAADERADPGATSAPNSATAKRSRASARDDMDSGDDSSGSRLNKNDSELSAPGDQRAARRTRIAAPSRPGAFQRYVHSSTGVDLPVFGSQFFEAAANTFTAPSNTPVAADYVVGPGDELLIRVWGAVDADVKTRVDRNGQINLPHVGTFTVAGVRAADLDKYLRGKIGRVFNNFQLSAALGQLRAVQVYVVGQALAPGVYTLPSHATLLSAVVASGGPGPNGSMRKVAVRRAGTLISELDIYEFLTQGDKAHDVALQSGDVVVFYPAGPRVALVGVIDSPGIFELKDKEETLSAVLKYAGGTTVLTSPHAAQLDRLDAARSQGARYVEPFNLDAKGLQKTLHDGDILTLQPASQQFTNAVTLRGHVAYPVRLPYKSGMHIRDLIPSREALMTPQSIQRKNALVQVTPFFPPKTEPGAEPAPNKGQAPASMAALASQATQTDAINWDYAVIERVDAKDLAPHWISFNLAKAMQSQDDPNNMALVAGDIVTIYGQDEMKVPQAKRSRLVSVEGEVAAPGIYELQPGENLAQVMQRAGGITAQAYLYGLEFDRESVRQAQEQNLKEAIERLEVQASTQIAKVASAMNDANDGQKQVQVAETAGKQQLEAMKRIIPNGRLALELKPQMGVVADLPEVPLEAGDRIVVPARPGFITVVGAVANRNALLWKEGRTAGDYLKMAGVQELADRAQAFIFRADGTVAHATDHRGFFGIGGGIDGEDIYPGDALIVPNQLDYESWGHAFTRNLKDWTQIMYQFGIGVSSFVTIRNNIK